MSSKRFTLLTLDLEKAHLCNERLASAQSLRELTIVFKKLHAKSEEEKPRLQEELHDLKCCLSKPVLLKAVSACDVGTMTNELVEQLSYEMSPLDDPSSNSSSDEDHSLIAQAEAHPKGLQPRGFKKILFRIDKFSGKDGNNDFEVWVEDYKEPTADRMDG